MTDRARVVLVSGASKGIGYATAVGLAARGFRVVAGVRRPEDGAALERETEGIVPVTLDLTDPGTIAGAVRRVQEAAADTGLWGLVNNAGVVYPGPMELLPLDALREQLEVNVVGTLALTQACLPSIRLARGRIVNVSSVNGRIVSPFTGAYAVSKFALEAMSDALRLELSRAGVSVVVIQPGAVRTAIWGTSRVRASALFERLPPDAHTHYGRVLERIRTAPMPRRAVAPERVARVIVRALTTRTPRTRYRVGWDARIGVALARLLPGRLLDALLLGRLRRQG